MTAHTLTDLTATLFLLALLVSTCDWLIGLAL